MKSGKTKRFVVTILIILFAAIFGGAAFRYFTTQKQVDEETAAVPVVIGFPERKTVEEILRYPGTLMSRETVTVVPKISGIIDAVSVREGDSVRQDEVLLLLRYRRNLCRTGK